VAHDAVVTVTEADVRALAAKLKGLHAQSTAAEQALLQAVLRRAAGSGSAGSAANGADGAIGAEGAEGGTWGVRFNPFLCLDTVAAQEFRGDCVQAPTRNPE
jgi:hypothetical protein